MRLVSLEGLDGVGKTHLAAQLTAELERRGYVVRYFHDVGTLPEGSKTKFTPFFGLDNPLTRDIYYAATTLSFAQVVDEIEKSDSADFIIVDRYIDSLRVYHSSPIDRYGHVVSAFIDWIVQIVPQPNTTLLLDPPKEVRRRRRLERGEEPDHPMDTFLRERYRILAHKNPRRFWVLEMEDPPVQEIANYLESLPNEIVRSRLLIF